jgi:hypothetical protein
MGRKARGKEDHWEVQDIGGWIIFRWILEIQYGI